MCHPGGVINIRTKLLWQQLHKEYGLAWPTCCWQEQHWMLADIRASHHCCVHGRNLMHVIVMAQWHHVPLHWPGVNLHCQLRKSLEIVLDACVFDRSRICSGFQPVVQLVTCWFQASLNGFEPRVSFMVSVFACLIGSVVQTTGSVNRRY